MLAAATAFSSTGHASTAEPRWLARTAIFIHSGSSMFWVGSLPVLLKRCLGAHYKEEGVLRVFSRLIPLPLTALIVSGAVVISLQVPKLSSLWTSSYGLILTIKLVFVITLLALACFNKFMSGRAAVARRIVEGEVFEVDELAVDPQRDAGVGEMRSSEPDRRAGDLLVKPPQ